MLLPIAIFTARTASRLFSYYLSLPLAFFIIQKPSASNHYAAVYVKSPQRRKNCFIAQKSHPFKDGWYLIAFGLL
jgi:hypothetical protein